ncbi:MAG: hydrogen peroxide-inducible genes activator [Pseudomonadota bacterium]
MQPITLRQCEYLIALEETRHFRRAAERCGVSQPSLSAQIQGMEAALGAQLVERSRTGASLTPIGRETAARARRILDEVQGLIDLTASARNGLVGTIRLGASPTLGPYLLPHVVAKLHRLHPDLSLYVRESAPRDLAHELARGVHDVILAQLPVSGAELAVERLFREPLYLIVARDHALAEREETTPSDLKGLRVITLSPQYQFHDQIRDLCEDFGATLLRDYEGTSLDAVRQMVGMNMGVGFVPALYAKSEIAPGSEVVAKTLSGRGVTRSIGLVWRKSAGRADAYRKIAATARDVAAKKFKAVIPET